MENCENYASHINFQGYIKECFSQPLDYEALISHCTKISELCCGVSLSYVGQSLLSRRIPMLSFGQGQRCVFYVGAHHGAEWICSCVLLAFLYELCECNRRGGRVHSASVPCLEKTRRICVIPMLNPDGVEIEIHGAHPSCPTYERLMRANGSSDFSLWQANARGVDLNHNYNAHFYEYKMLERSLGILGAAPTKYSGEYPESEPESAALCNLLRYIEPSLVLSLHSQGEVIYSGESLALPCGEMILERLCVMTGYKAECAQGGAACGGLSDWYSAEMKRPAYTVELGKGQNPLPLSQGEGIYQRVREALFSSPMMI